jgi:hypothetical protein
MLLRRGHDISHKQPKLFEIYPQDHVADQYRYSQRMLQRHFHHKFGKFHLP